jgi:hypothetical protein
MLKLQWHEIQIHSALKTRLHPHPSALKIRPFIHNLRDLRFFACEKNLNPFRAHLDISAIRDLWSRDLCTKIVGIIHPRLLCADAKVPLHSQFFSLLAQ